MFCMNCGQQLPDGAKFCLNCGTPQGAVSPNGSTESKSDNTKDNSTFKPAMCPNCNAHMKVDPSCMLARCDACGTECLVQDAIKALASVTVKQDIQVGNATFNVSSTNTDALLKRIEIMLADGDFRGAMSKCDTILDSDPTNGKVYFFMLMCNLGCKNRNDLANQPVPFVDNQNYIKAIQYGDDILRSELGEYVNTVNERVEAERKRKEEENEAKLKNPKTGDYFYFGSYNGKRISWEVLRIQDRMALIISSEICSMQYQQSGDDSWPYLKSSDSITWSDCTLRKWLNNDFINGSFSQMERTKILPCKLNNDNNPRYNTPGGDSTTDKVFLLSIYEVEYFQANHFSYWINICKGWWLRTPGKNPNYVAYVDNEGSIITDGYNAGGKYIVRPAMWIKLDP